MNDMKPAMQTEPLCTETINTMIERQLYSWPLARDNFFNLGKVRRKPVILGDLAGAVQFNPARILSTGANVDKKSISSRPCFLCKDNRPECQASIPWPTSDWELLVNPYPILPVHFTIASASHVPQERIPADIMLMAEAAPSLAIFFNGARAGASAPDHLHLQGVLASELPLLHLAEKFHPETQAGIMSSAEAGLNVPFHFLSAVITPDIEGMRDAAALLSAFGMDGITGKNDPGLVNAFFWIGKGGSMRCVIVPRKRHRPLCYGSSGEEMLVSPGAIDMAGLMITPREEDFGRLDADKMREIYSDVAFADSLPEKLSEFFRTHSGRHGSK